MFGGVKSLKHNMGTTLQISGDSRISKVGCHFGVKEKVGGQCKCLFCMNIFYVNQKNFNVNLRHYWGPANGPPRPPLELSLLRLAYHGCKNLTHTSKVRQIQFTQKVETARFMIRVLVTFSDC